MLLMEEARESRQASLFPDEEEPPDSMLDRFKSLIKNADFGIIDMRVNRNAAQGARYRTSSGLELKHQHESDDAWLPIEEESRGTRTLFQLALPILGTIQRGRILVVDELEASMHPNLAEHIIRQFNDPQSNPRNAQLIFSTHDTNLLGTLSGSPRYDAMRCGSPRKTCKARQSSTL